MDRISELERALEALILAADMGRAVLVQSGDDKCACVKLLQYSINDAKDVLKGYEQDRAG